MSDLSDAIDGQALSAVDPSTSILIAGPAMSGVASLATAVLASGARRSEGVVTVTTGETADTVIADLRSRVPEPDPGHLAAVDCRGSRREDQGAADGEFRYHVADPSDLTGMGVGITRSLARLRSAGLERIRLGFVSLSTMLAYAETEAVFKFCHVLASRLDTAGYLSVVTIDPVAHDEATLRLVTQPFDLQIEIREREGDREARVRGPRPEPADCVGV